MNFYFNKIFKSSGAISGAAFLMATSAIGPGFINNTSLFTQELGANFGFIILAALLLDIIIQLCVWLTIGLKGQYAQEIANEIIPGSGHVLSILIASGGFVFNIGNMAGCVLGLQLLTGLSLFPSVVISMAVALPVLFVGKGKALDRFSFLLGVVMIGLMLWAVFSLDVPWGAAIHSTILPEKTDTSILLTIIGGTVGGYISFAGAHHLVDSGISGQEHFYQVRASAVRGIIITSLMRYLLYLAAFAVVAAGIVLAKDNPASTIFLHAAGSFGEKLFGLVLWSAAITSVVGSSYTSFSFVQTLHPVFRESKKIFLTLFISASSLFLLLAGKPVKLLVLAGAFNGIILPFALLIILIIIFKNRKQPYWEKLTWISIPGWIVAGGLFYMSYEAIRRLFQ